MKLSKNTQTNEKILSTLQQLGAVVLFIIFISSFVFIGKETESRFFVIGFWLYILHVILWIYYAQEPMIWKHGNEIPLRMPNINDINPIPLKDAETRIERISEDIGEFLTEENQDEDYHDVLFARRREQREIINKHRRSIQEYVEKVILPAQNYFSMKNELDRQNKLSRLSFTDNSYFELVSIIAFPIAVSFVGSKFMNESLFTISIYVFILSALVFFACLLLDKNTSLFHFYTFEYGENDLRECFYQNVNIRGDYGISEKLIPTYKKDDFDIGPKEAFNNYVILAHHCHLFREYERIIARKARRNTVFLFTLLTEFVFLLSYGFLA